MKHIVLAWCLAFAACAYGADRQSLHMAYGYSTADSTAQSGVFTSAFQRFFRNEVRGSRSGTIKSQPTAVALGYKFAKDNWFAGLSASFEHATRKYDFSSEYMKVRDKTYGGTIFGGFKFDTGLYAKGSFFLGHHDTKAKRAAVRGFRLDPSSSDNGTRVAASVELGWLFCTPADW